MTRTITEEIRQMPRGEWTRISEIALKVDATPEQVGQAIINLMFAEDLEIMPESNRKTLGQMDHLYAVAWGGDENHLIKWI